MSRSVEVAVGRVAGWLAAVYALDLGIRAEDCELSLTSDLAPELLPTG